MITLGFSEQDPVLALGVAPIAVREWFDGFDHATWLWAQEALADGMPEVLEISFGELSYETVAAIAPDLIVATHGGITEEEYEVLSEIAPTLVEAADVPSFGMSRQDQTLMIGEALGLSEEARQQVLVKEAATLDTARTNDDFGNATFAWANPTGEGTYWIVGATTPPMLVLQSLGLVCPDTIGDVVGEADSFELSGEQVSLLDVDVLIVQASDDIKQSIIDDPLWQQLGFMTEDRILWLDSDDPVYGALSFATVPSIDYPLDELPSS